MGGGGGGMYENPAGWRLSTVGMNWMKGYEGQIEVLESRNRVPLAEG